MTKPRRRRVPWWLEIPLALALALGCALVVTTWFVQAFVIPSSSMRPTLVKHDRIVVEKWSTWSGLPERGDVVVFRDPGEWLDEQERVPVLRRLTQDLGLAPKGGHLVKRVIGLPGDEVRCCDARGRTLVNGRAIDEPYLADATANADVTFQVTVPRDRLWVEGDNRGDSEDSRLQMDGPTGGFVPVDHVVGRVWSRVWPLGRFGPPAATRAFDDVPAPAKG